MEQDEKQQDVPQVNEVHVDYKDQAMRAQADYQNLQKEVAAQRAQWAKMSEVHILEEFIPVYENFKKAFAHEPGGEDNMWENWKQGIGYIMKQFGDILRNHGVEEVETVGKPFDPTVHEAVGEEASDEYEEGVVVREVAGGYRCGDTVIQVARVILCKK